MYLEERDELPTLIRCLLGDWCNTEIATVQQWVAMENSVGGEDTMVGFDVNANRIRSLAADLHDSRLHKVMNLSRSMLANFGEQTDKRQRQVLVELLCGRARSWLRRYAAADRAYNRAVDLADLDALTYVAECLRVLNLSDWGEPINREETIATKPSFEASPEVLLLLDAMRTLVYSRVLLRSGRREEGFALLDAFCSEPQFATLAPIPRGLMVRMRGILCAVSNRTMEACSDLRVASEVFHLSGFSLGEVQSALSLGRVQVPTDPRITALCLERARAIIDETDHVGSRREDARHMPGERADLYARLAELELSKGRADTAVDFCRRDLHTLLEIASQKPEALPRPIAHSKRNLGRACAANGNHQEAVRQLYESAAGFGAVNDMINVFFSLASRTESLVAIRDFSTARTTLNEMAEILDRFTGREKERATLDLLTALRQWRGERDSAAAGRVAQAKSVFEQYGRDYYYARALLLEGEILEGDRDVPAAVQAYAEAHRCAAALELDHVRREAERALEQLGIDRAKIPMFDRTELEQRCDQEGFVASDLTILFADIRGFTGAAAAVDPSEMAAFIGEFASTVSRCISQFRGLPIRYLGDCVMAIFGANADLKGKENDALAAAVSIYHRFQAIRERWGVQSTSFARLGIGFGISSGRVFAGRFGFGELAEFSVVGHAVNLASRLQATADDGEIVLCSETAQRTRLSGQPRNCDLKGLGQTASTVVLARDLHRAPEHRRPSPRPLAP